MALPESKFFSLTRPESITNTTSSMVIEVSKKGCYKLDQRKDKI